MVETLQTARLPLRPFKRGAADVLFAQWNDAEEITLGGRPARYYRLIAKDRTPA